MLIHDLGSNSEKPDTPAQNSFMPSSFRISHRFPSANDNIVSSNERR